LVLWLALVFIAAAFIAGWIVRDSTIPVPEVDSPEGTFPKEE